MTWGSPVQSFVFLALLVFELEPMYATSDRQTDGRIDGRTTDADDRLMPPPPLRGRGHNKPTVPQPRRVSSDKTSGLKVTKDDKYVYVLYPSKCLLKHSSGGNSYATSKFSDIQMSKMFLLRHRLECTKLVPQTQ